MDRPGGCARWWSRRGAAGCCTTRRRAATERGTRTRTVRAVPVGSRPRGRLHDPWGDAGAGPSTPASGRVRPGSTAPWAVPPPGERTRSGVLPLTASVRGESYARADGCGGHAGVTKCRECRIRTADWGWKPMRRMGMPITPASATHRSSNGTAEAILLELVDENGTRSARRRSSPPTNRRAGSTGPSRCSCSTSRGGCCSSSGRWASTTPPVSGRTPAAVTPPRRGALRGSRPADLRGARRLPVPDGAGGHGPLQPPGPGLGPGGAGIQPPVRRPGAVPPGPGPEEVGATAFVTAGERRSGTPRTRSRRGS